MILRVQNFAHGVSTSGEGSLHLEGGVEAHGKLIVDVMGEHEPDIRYGARAEDLRVADLNVSFGLLRGIALRRQSELADSVILAVGVKELIPRGERIVRGHLRNPNGSSDSYWCWGWAPLG